MMNPFLKVERAVRRIGIFGGTFDPPTIGHHHLVAQALSYLKLDEIWIVPNGQPHGKQPKANYQQRLDWCRWSFRDMRKVYVRDLEPDGGDEPHYTWRTLQRLRDTHPNIDFTLLMGSDQWENFPNWAEHDYIASMADIAILERDALVSSTAVREALAAGDHDTARYMLHRDVSDHLQATNPYLRVT